MSAGSIEKQKKREAAIQKYADLRKELKCKIRNVNLTMKDRVNAMLELNKLTRYSCRTAYRNMCSVRKSFRGFFRDFGLGRHALRELALQGSIPGVKKASW